MRIKEVSFSGYYDHSYEELVELKVYGKHLNSVSSKNATRYKGREPHMNSVKLLETDPLFNVDIFIDKVTFVSGSRAIGDQLGTILGGWWHVNYDTIVLPEQAIEIIEPFIEFYEGLRPEKQESKDENACLQVILSRQERAENPQYPKKKIT